MIKKEVLEKWASIYTKEEVANKLGIPINNILYYARKNKIKFKRKSFDKKQRFELKYGTFKSICNELRIKSLQDVADRIGITKQGLSDFLKRNGYKKYYVTDKEIQAVREE